jgi:hypothetical protein
MLYIKRKENSFEDSYRRTIRPDIVAHITFLNVDLIILEKNRELKMGGKGKEPFQMNSNRRGFSTRAPFNTCEIVRFTRNQASPRAEMVGLGVRRFKGLPG